MKQEEARKKHSIWKGLLSSLLTGTDALTWGIPILGLPQAEEIVSARATFAESTAEVKPADMELAQNLPGVLHAWFGRAEERMPQAVMTYTLADGSEVVVAADEGVICFDGRYRCPKGSSGKLFYHMVQDFVEGRDKKNGGIKQCWKIRARNG